MSVQACRLLVVVWSQGGHVGRRLVVVKWNEVSISAGIGPHAVWDGGRPAQQRWPCPRIGTLARAAHHIVVLLRG